MSIKTNKEGFVKQNDGLVLNNNLSDLEKYRAKRDQLLRNKRQDADSKRMENRINALEQKLDLLIEKLLKD